MRICGREFSTSLLERIQDVIASAPELSRRALSRKVCEWLDWRSANGALHEEGCRKALAELARRGAVALPAAARAIVRQPAGPVELDEAAVALPLEALGTVSLVVVEAGSEDAKRWRALLDGHHYRVLSAMLREIPALAWYLGRPVTTVREACPGHRVYLQPPRNWLKPPRRLPNGGAPARAVLAFRRSCGRKRPNSPSGTASPRLRSA